MKLRKIILENDIDIDSFIIPRGTIVFVEEVSIDKEKLLQFFIDNPYPDDFKLHEFADSMGIDTHILEGEVYKILSTFLSGGFAKEKGISEKDVDKGQLEKGIKVEYEHVDKKSDYADMIAKRIALDHLAELDDYYDKLEIIEYDIE